MKVVLAVLPGEDAVVEVGLNGEMTLIRRGEEVVVSASVAEVLRHAGLLKEG